MNDAEAEALAVLVALGPTIQWFVLEYSDATDWRGTPNGFESDVYSILKCVGSELYECSRYTNRGGAARSSLSAAKAACERHHATGAWQ